MTPIQPNIHTEPPAVRRGTSVLNLEDPQTQVRMDLLRSQLFRSNAGYVSRNERTRVRYESQINSLNPRGERNDPSMHIIQTRSLKGRVEKLKAGIQEEITLSSSHLDRLTSYRRRLLYFHRTTEVALVGLPDLFVRTEKRKNSAKEAEVDHRINNEKEHIEALNQAIAKIEKKFPSS